MANAIPPLMCNTPPPMDGGCFEDDDEDDLSMAGSIHDGMCCGGANSRHRRHIFKNIDENTFVVYMFHNIHVSAI